MPDSTDEARANQVAINYSKLSEADRAQFEKAFWKINAIPDPKAGVVPETPSQKWFLANPQTLEKSEPGYLCEICQHVDFKYLIDAPIWQVLEEFTLFNLNWVVEKGESCCFCRLILRTIKGLLGGRELATEVKGKDVVCQFRALPMETGFTGRGEINLLLQPKPEGIHTGINFSEFIPKEIATVGYRLSVQCLEIDFELVKKWCHQCLTGQCGFHPTVVQEKNMPNGFRLIDVKDSCIVEFEPDYRYVALSYVWGGVATLQNKKAVREELTETGALIKRSHELPNTIKDAMKLTDILGERYLWVDRLCIIQDDAEDKALQIAAMDPIYSSAILTIAATSGTAADTGLPGMSTGPRDFQRHIEKVQGIYLANCPKSFGVAVGESIWNSRAWTLQEKLVSPRVLYLGAQACFFTCQHRQDEFLESEDPRENGLGRTNRPKRSKTQSVNLISQTSQSVNILLYRRVVEAYTSRHLTFPSDILNAFKAIEARLHPLFRSDFVFGLPRSELDSQLLWQPEGPIQRRRDPKTNLTISPSWSWAGWVGEVECNVNENLSRIKWIEADGTQYSSEDFRYPASVNADVFKRLAYRIEWRAALEAGVPYYMERDNPDTYFFHPTAPGNERKHGPNLKAGTDHLVFEAEMEEGTDAFHIGGHYLTWALRKNACTEDTHTVCPLVIRDADGYVAGYVMVPGEFATQLGPTNRCNLINLSRTKKREQKGRGEGNPDLLVDEKDVTMEKQSFPDRPGVEKAGDSSACDQTRYDTEKAWCLYNVMLVEWIGEVAYRLGVGTVHIDAWAQAKPRKTIITLG